MSEPTTKPDLSALWIDRTAEQTPGSSKLWLWIGLSLVVVVAAVLAVFFVVRDNNTGSSGSLRTVRVRFSNPAQGEVLLTASGYVVAQRKASVSSKATGRLVWLGVVEGDVVQQGELLAQVESEDVEAELERTTANVAQSQADSARAVAELNVASLEFERQKILMNKRLIAPSVYDAAEARYLTAKAWVAQTTAAIDVALAAEKAAQVAVENTRIRAPFDGTVLTKEADVGEMVAPFASSASSRGAVVTMADMASLQVEADVSESNITRVRLDAPCDIVLDAYPDFRYHGHVEKIVPTADRAKATVLTKVVIDDIDERVLPEMSAKVYFLGSRKSGVENSPSLMVPASAVRRENGNVYVFRVINEKARKTLIALGTQEGDDWVISSGLQRGDKVIADPPANLDDGDSIGD